MNRNYRWSSLTTHLEHIDLETSSERWWSWSRRIFFFNKSCPSSLARGTGAGDQYVVQGISNNIDTLRQVNAEVTCDEEPWTIEIARVLVSWWKTNVLTESTTPRGSKRRRGRGQRANLAIPTQLRARRAQLMNNCEIDVGADHRQMAWRIRHCTWILNRFPVKGGGRTAYTNTQGKQCDKELVQFQEVCSFRTHDADAVKLELRWTEGVFVGKHEKIDEFLLLTSQRSAGTSSFEDATWERILGRNFWESVLVIRGIPTSLHSAPRGWKLRIGTSSWWMDRSSIKRNLHQTTHSCLGCEMRGVESEVFRNRIEQYVVDAGQAFDTDAQRHDSAALPNQNLTTRMNLRPRKPDLILMRQPEILQQRSLRWTVCCERHLATIWRTTQWLGQWNSQELNWRRPEHVKWRIW